MSDNSATTTGGLAWWIWMPVIHGLFLFFLYYQQVFVGYNTPHAIQHLSLARENNLAAWWSGFCLMTAGVLFYHLASITDDHLKDRLMWFGLAIIVCGLSIDETGSLHERVSLLGGWWALLPFGVIGAVVFVYAVGRCLFVGRHRYSGLLILLSFCFFISAAGMEHVGNIFQNKASLFFRYRLLIEEGIELFASFALILAATHALAKRRSGSWYRVDAIVNPLSLTRLQEILVLGLIMHMGLTILAMPYLWDPYRGNPVYWFPMLCFALSAFFCWHNFQQNGKFVWLLGVILFIALCMGQMINLGVFLDALLDLPLKQWSTGLPWTIGWTAAPLFAWLFFQTRWKWWAIHTGLLVLLAVILRDGQHLFETYYIFSAAVALLAFNLLLRNSADFQAQSDQV